MGSATSGGANGQRLEKLLAKSGFPVKVVPIKNDIRTNFTITDRQGLAIKLNEQGPQISADELARVEKTVEGRLDGADGLMLGGTEPPEVSANFSPTPIPMAPAPGGKPTR